MQFRNISIRLGAAAAICAVMVAPGVVNADGKQDLYFQQAKQRYFNQPQNARTFGMAGSSIQSSTDSSSVVGNPAGLGLMQRGDASVSYGLDNISGNENSTYREVEQEENSLQGLLAMPLGPYADAPPEWGTLGLGWSGYDGDVDDDPFGAETDGQRITAAYGAALGDGWSVGYSLAYFNDEYKNSLYSYDMDNGLRNTIGVMNQVDKDLRVGMTAFWGFGEHDLEGVGLDGTSDQDEFGIGLGGEQMVGEATSIAFGIDYEYYDTEGDLVSADPAVVFGGDEEGHVLNLSVGVEHAITDYFKVRAGYMYGGNLSYDADRVDLRDDLDGSAKYNGFSAGVGASLPIGKEYYVEAVNIDYGAQYRAIGEDDWQHIVTVSTPFSPCD